MNDLKKNALTLKEKKAAVELGGGEQAIAKQKAMGKLTARERIAALLDKDSFQECDMFVKHDGRDFGMDKKDFPGDGVVTGMVRSPARRYVSMLRILPYQEGRWA